MIVSDSPIQYFRAPREAEAARPKLDRDAPMHKAEYAGLTGVYSFPEVDWVTCQLIPEGATAMCGQVHGNGFIMRRTDGVEGYLGQDCAKKEFDAHHEFGRDTAAARRVVRKVSLVERLGDLLAHSMRRERIVEGFTRQRTLRRQIAKVRDDFPHAVKEWLYSASKRGHRVIELDFMHMETIEDKDGKDREVPRWHRERIGAVAAPGGLDLRGVEKLGERFRASLAAADSAEANAEMPDKELLQWAEALEDADRCELDLEEAEEAFSTFLHPDNCRLLCWVCRKTDDQITTAGVALGLAARRKVSTEEAEAAFRAWRGELLATYRGLQLRIP